MIKDFEKLPEVFVSDKNIKTLVNRELKKGSLRKIASRLYTKNLIENPELIVKRNIWSIVASYFPGALISDRTAIENKPAKDGSIFIISTKKHPIILPSVTIYPRKGHKPLESDSKFVVDGLFLSSTARAYLENMLPSRGRNGKETRTLSRKEMEERLDNLLRKSGEIFLLDIRDKARLLAHELSLKKEFEELNKLIGAILGTKKDHLVSDVGLMRQAGLPYDPDRVSLFKILSEELNKTAPIIRLQSYNSQEATVNLALFESYFSNFIEGTEFAIDEAKEIILDGKIPESRPEDAHDIIGTFRIASDIVEMQKTPKLFEEFISLLKIRHAMIMSSRQDKEPGVFKKENNRAGNTLFVNYQLVEGTLLKGFEMYQSLESAFARAVFMMFIVSEVHPFADGNGRTARIMMNAELVAFNQQRIIIPIVYRNNYLASLKALSQNRIVEPLIRTLDFAQKYTSSINWQYSEICQQELQQTNAFLDSSQAELIGKRLLLPM